MKKEDLNFIGQLIQNLQESEKKLEETFEKKDEKNFNLIKKEMLNVQGQILKAAK